MLGYLLIIGILFVRDILRYSIKLWVFYFGVINIKCN